MGDSDPLRARTRAAMILPRPDASAHENAMTPEALTGDVERPLPQPASTLKTRSELGLFMNSYPYEHPLAVRERQLYPGPDGFVSDAASKDLVLASLRVLRRIRTGPAAEAPLLAARHKALTELWKALASLQGNRETIVHLRGLIAELEANVSRTPKEDRRLTDAARMLEREEGRPEALAAAVVDARAALKDAQRRLVEGPTTEARALGALWDQGHALAEQLRSGRRELRYPTDPNTDVLRFMDQYRPSARRLEDEPVTSFSHTCRRRSFDGYATLFALEGDRQRFLDDLAALGPDEVWLDIGCGEGNAIADAKHSGAVKALAIGTDPFTDPRHASDPALGVEFRADSAADLTLEVKASVATDVHANMAYQPDFVKALMEDLEHVRTGGLLYATMNDTLNVVVGPAGDLRPLSDWLLTRIPGLEVELVDQGVRIRKASDVIEPPPLELVGFAEGTPSTRIYLDVSQPEPHSPIVTWARQMQSE